MLLGRFPYLVFLLGRFMARDSSVANLHTQGSHKLYTLGLDSLSSSRYAGKTDSKLAKRWIQTEEFPRFIPSTNEAGLNPPGSCLVCASSLESFRLFLPGFNEAAT